MARSEGMLLKVSSLKGRCALEGLALTGWHARRRQDLLELYDLMNRRITPLEAAIEKMAETDPAARRLLGHPGVGPVTAVYFPLVVGDPERFPTAGHVSAYLGLLPAEDSSGPRRRWGPITRQGNRLARFLLVEAGQAAARVDPEFRRFYQRLARSKGRPKAKIAVARKLAARLFLLYQSGLEYAEWRAQSRVRMQAQPE
jgi:transposase